MGTISGYKERKERSHLCVFKDVMRLVTLRYDCNTLLHMVPQQYLGKHICYSKQYTCTHLQYTHTDLCRALSVLLGYICNNGVLQELIWITVSSEPKTGKIKERKKNL